MFTTSFLTTFFSSLDSSKVKIKSPSETLSPTLILTDLILPSTEDGISTLDLSLSIVINGSFLDNDWPFETNTSITSTFLNSPIFGTLILYQSSYSFVGIGLLPSILYFFIASFAYFEAINCSFAKTLNP